VEITMTTLLGVLYYALPGIAVALAVSFALAVTLRGQRKWVISAIWFGIALLATALLSRKA
jgi:hypothetical protein